MTKNTLRHINTFYSFLLNMLITDVHVLLLEVSKCFSMSLWSIFVVSCKMRVGLAHSVRLTQLKLNFQLQNSCCNVHNSCSHWLTFLRRTYLYPLARNSGVRQIIVCNLDVRNYKSLMYVQCVMQTELYPLLIRVTKISYRVAL